MRTARIYAAATMLVLAWALSRGRLAQQQARLLSRRAPLSERLGLLDDHLAEWR